MPRRTRYFENVLDDTKDVRDTAMREKVLKAVVWCLEHIKCEQGVSGPSIYTGTSGVALMFYRLASLLEADSLLAKALGYTAQEALREASILLHQTETLFRSSRVVTFLEGLPGCLALKAAVEHKLDSKSGKAAEAQQMLLDLVSHVTQLPANECEVLYGRCGYLSALYFVRRELNAPTWGAAAAKPILRQIVYEGLREGKRTFEQYHLPIFYSWHGQAYLGAAHGIVGILQMLMLFPEEWDDLQQHYSLPYTVWDLAFNTVSSILKFYTTPSGHVFSACGRERDDHNILVHWCHGSPGMVMLLSSMLRSNHDMSHDQRSFLLAAVVKLGNAIWERGLLRKGLGLCHGIGGNAIVLLHAALVADDSAVWVRRARKRLNTLASLPDRPDSLFEGLSGFIWSMCDILEPQKTSFPGMD